METKNQTRPDQHPFIIRLIAACTTEVVVFLTFPLSVKMDAHLQGALMYCYRNPPDDAHLADLRMSAS